METITLVKLEAVVVNRPAPKPDGKNLWIDIDVNLSKSTALIHCQEEESVGMHKKRTVTFRADHDCLMTFTEQRVFDRESVQLMAHRQVILSIKDTTANIQTSYDIYNGTSIVEAAEVPHEMARVLGGPHIVVP